MANLKKSHEQFGIFNTMMDPRQEALFKKKKISKRANMTPMVQQYIKVQDKILIKGDGNQSSIGT